MMQLTYRGHSYPLAYTPMPLTDTGLMATYGGTTYPVKQTISSSTPPRRRLTNRGVAYIKSFGAAKSPIHPNSLTQVSVVC